MKNKNLVLFTQYGCALVLTVTFGLAVYIQFFYLEIPHVKHSGSSSPVAKPEKRSVEFKDDVIIPEVVDAFDIRTHTPESNQAPAGKELTPNRNVNRDKIVNELILRFDEHEEMQEFIDLAQGTGVDILNTLEEWNSLHIQVNHEDLISDLLRHFPNRVDYSPNYYVRIPNHPETYPGDNNTRVTDSVHYSPFKKSALSWLGMEESDTSSGQGIVIAVLDSGLADPTLFGDRVVGEIDLIGESVNLSGNTSALTTEFEVNGHGTAVTSIIVGNSELTPGVASGADLLSVRVLDGNGIGDVFSVAKGIIEAVDAGADIINMSLGTYANSWILEEAVNYARENNVALVAAVGNDGMERVAYPAKYEGVIAVSAVDASEQHTHFSNRGHEVDIAAPGIGIYAAWLGNQTVSFSGTSAAAPYVAGTLASLLSSDPSLTVTEAIEIVLSNTNDVGAPGVDPEFGHGILNMKRIRERNQAGIRDIAVSSFFLDQETISESNLRLIVSVQNRGTEWLPRVYIALYMDSSEEIYEFTSIEVGETVSRAIIIDIDKLGTKGEIRIHAMTSIDGWQDAYPENNYRSSILKGSGIN